MMAIICGGMPPIADGKHRTLNTNRGHMEEITATEAKAIEAQEIVEKCKVEIQEILDRHGCRLEVSMIVKGTGNTPQVIIVKDDK